MLKRGWRLGASLAAIGVLIAPAPTGSQQISTLSFRNAFDACMARGRFRD